MCVWAGEAESGRDDDDGTESLDARDLDIDTIADLGKWSR